MNEMLTQLGVGGIFAVLVIKMVLDFVTNRERPTIDAVYKEVVESSKKTAELWDWHNVNDPVTGEKSWYTSRESREMLLSIKKCMENNTEAINSLTLKIETVVIKIENIG